MLKIYNSFTKDKQEFKPIHRNKISIYVCGMTVYDFCHLGHARVLVCFDVIVRYLRSRGYEVKYVRNITDIDDKIIKRAADQDKPWQQLTEHFIDEMHADTENLSLVAPDAEPKATKHIFEIVQMIEKLIANGHGYVAANGDVYYDVSRFKNYGKLANKDLLGQEAGARVEVVSVKRNPLDFVLWKMAKPEEPSWDSPWGAGRPGWHIECSAMSTHCLGEHFDIHGGGFDLQFPHHENEIAQAEGASGKKFVNTWMHVGYLQINREKMSKSLGNFFTIREVLAKYPAEVVRYFLLSSHYRTQLNYSTDNLDNARGALERLYGSLRDLPEDEVAAELSNMGVLYDDPYQQRFRQAMDDDFNVPEALAVLFEITHVINRFKTTDLPQAIRHAASLKKLAQVLGILEHSAEEFLQGAFSTEQVQLIEQLINDRNQARANKEWQTADEIRQQLLDMGVELEDGVEGSSWRQA